jgi:pimeloyl-ACP methyl ester carboxylesterase
MIRGYEERQISLGGVTTNYVKGPKNGPALMLIPGQSASWESYDKVLPGLSEDFSVYAVDVRGHGKSSWTTGEYNFNSIGGDFASFIEEVVGEPAIVSGNSSGGLIALWLAANKPSLVRGAILEDAPLFSADWPRIKDEFVYEVLEKTARHLGAEGGPDYEGLFRSIERPTADGGTRTLPGWLIRIIAWLIRVYERPGEPIDIPLLPRRLRLLVKVMSTFDPDFSRSWVDGRIYEGLDHEEALRRVDCPMLVIHADWYRTDKGLVGAMDDEDAKRARELAPHAEYIRLHTRHVTHSGDPKEFIRIVKNFADKISAEKG